MSTSPEEFGTGLANPSSYDIIIFLIGHEKEEILGHMA